MVLAAEPLYVVLVFNCIVESSTVKAFAKLLPTTPVKPDPSPTNPRPALICPDAVTLVVSVKPVVPIPVTSSVIILL